MSGILEKVLGNHMWWKDNLVPYKVAHKDWNIPRFGGGLRDYK